MKKLLSVALLIGLLGLVAQNSEGATTATTLVSDGYSVKVDATTSFSGPYWKYEYKLTHVNKDIRQFRVYNPFGFTDITDIISPSTGGWFSTLTPTDYSWIHWATTGTGLTTGSLSGFSFKSTGIPGTVAAQAWNGQDTLGGQTTGPTPEPTSLLLLGTGLLGLAALGRRKRRKV